MIGRDLEHLFHFAWAEIAAGLTERGFGLQDIGADDAFHHDLCLRRDHAVEGLRRHHLDYLAVQRAGDTVFLHAVGHLARRGQQQRRRPAQEHRTFEMLAHAPRLFPLDGEMLGGHVGGAADAVGRLDHAAIDAEIVSTVFRVACDPDPGSQKRCGIETGCRY